MSGTTMGNGIWTVRPLDIGLTIVDPGDPTSGDDRFDGDAILVLGVLDGVAVTLSPTSTDNYADGGGGDDWLFGNGGKDTLVGGEGADLLDGGSGKDTASYVTSGEGVRVDLRFGSGSAGDAEGDVLQGIERLTGSFYADTLNGSDAADTLFGGNGNDSLTGFAGKDVLNGGRGDDSLNGGADKDQLNGSQGDDFLNGAAGNDKLDGAEGDDILVGGADADLLTGGTGADQFRWSKLTDSTKGARDTITDFSSADGDRLDLSAFDVTYAGGGKFTGDGEGSVIWRASDDGYATVQVDADGDSTADFVVRLLGVTSLSESDFNL